METLRAPALREAMISAWQTPANEGRRSLRRATPRSKEFVSVVGSHSSCAEPGERGQCAGWPAVTGLPATGTDGSPHCPIPLASAQGGKDHPISIVKWEQSLLEEADHAQAIRNGGNATHRRDGCGDGGSGIDQGQVLTTLEVSPPTAALFTVAPGNTAVLTIVAKDQRGEVMTGLGSPRFSNDNSAVASVSLDGTITAAGAGTARVTASLTADGATATGTTTVSAQVAPAAASVNAPELAFQPQSVDVSMGGTVTWFIGDIHHTVTFTSPGSPASVPEIRNASAARAFPNQGTFAYQCSIHPGMHGSVKVH